MAELRTDARAALAPERDIESYGALDEEKAPAVSQASSRPPSVRQQYPLNMTVDFTKLRANALRRYMAFHGIREVPGSCREQLAIVVAQHFGEQCKVADEETSIASFVSYIKGIRVQNDSSDTDSHSDSSNGDSDAFELGGRDHRDRHETFAMGGSHDAADTDNHSSASSSDNEGMFMSDTTPTKKAKRSHPSVSNKGLKSQHSGSSSSSPGGGSKSHSSSKGSSKKQRKTRLYCVCKGASFGNMIACDNKKCSDRSNWYHMACVDLDPSQDPPETWYCPSCQEIDGDGVPENQYRKPVASVTYGDMISHALTSLPHGKGSFKDICDFVEKQYESQLNWKLESDQRKSPVWKSSVRKILFSNMRFRKHPDDKGLFCLAA